MQALIMLGGLIVAFVGQKLNSNPKIPSALVKFTLAGIGILIYLLVERPAGWPGSPAFLEWIDDAMLWALALPGAASLIGTAPGLATRVAVILITCGIFVMPAPAFAQTTYPPAKVFGASVGINGVWTHGADIRSVSDVEAALHLEASLSPHISLVGSGGYAFVNEYGFAQAGPRITVSDAKDRTLSVGVGIQYRWLSDEEYGLREWRPDVVIGWRPPGFPDDVILGAAGSYGLTGEEPQAILAARYVLY